jgi:hypothetical protein
MAQDRLAPDIAAGPPAVTTVPDWLAWAVFPQPTANLKREPSYPELRNQTLSHGFAGWDLRALVSGDAGRTQEEPDFDREQFNRWLKREGVGRELRPLATPALHNPSGA